MRHRKMLEPLAVEAFLDGLWDDETKQALILALPDKLVKALAHALEFETVSQLINGKLKDSLEEPTINEAAVKNYQRRLVLSEKKSNLDAGDVKTSGTCRMQLLNRPYIMCLPRFWKTEMTPMVDSL